MHTSKILTDQIIRLIDNYSFYRIDFKGPSIQIGVSLPKLIVNSDYTIKGKILLVPINGNGKSNGTFCKYSIFDFYLIRIEKYPYF